MIVVKIIVVLIANSVFTESSQLHCTISRAASEDTPFASEQRNFWGIPSHKNNRAVLVPVWEKYRWIRRVGAIWRGWELAMTGRLEGFSKSRGGVGQVSRQPDTCCRIHRQFVPEGACSDSIHPYCVYNGLALHLACRWVATSLF